MPIETKETLENINIRDRLLQESRLQPEVTRPGYVNGVLDMYNAAKKLQEGEEA